MLPGSSKNPPQVIDCVTWTFYGTHSTAQAHLLIDHSTVVCYPDYSCGTCFLTDSASDAAYLALFLRLCSLLFVRAFDYDVVCTFMDVNDLLRTGFHTFFAGNAF